MRIVSTAYSGIPSARRPTPSTSSTGQPRRQRREHPRDLRRCQWLERSGRQTGRRPRSSGRVSASTKIGEICRPLEHVVDEVQEPAFSPVQIFEDEDDRRVLGQAFEEQPPAGEQVGPISARALLEPQEMRESRLDHPPVAFIGHELLDHGRQLLARRVRGVLLEDRRAGPDHLGQRPVRDSLAVGRRPSLVPVAGFLDAVEVLEEFPHQPRLAEPSLPHNRDMPRATLPALWSAALTMACSSASRPTNGGSSPALRRAPPAPATTRRAVQACTGCSRPLTWWVPPSS